LIAALASALIASGMGAHSGHQIQPENDTPEMARQLSAFQAHSHPIRDECQSLILIDGAWRRINPTAGSRRPGGATRPKSGAWVAHKWRICDAWVAHFCVESVR
jgi:hypothetical protein